MSVLVCDRNACENIMCHYYSQEHGNICSSCLTELQQAGPTCISGFMNSPKAPEIDVQSWREALDAEFRNRWED